MIFYMAIDKLINSTQGDSIIAALNAISSKVGSPYNLENKLNPAYINYDSTHAATPETVANSGITSTDVAQIEMNKNNISWLVDTGVKNLLDYGKIKTFNPLFTWSGNTGTYNGVTIKIESNAVKISASNASSTVHIYVSSETDTWKNGNTYRLMGVPQASAENVNLNIQSGSPDYYTYYTKISNQEVTFPNVDTRIRFSIASGATFSEVTIPLMMCSVTAYSASPAYQPYAMSNAELTAKEQTNENNILSLENSIIKMVAHTSANGSTSLSYETNINDFAISGGANSDKSSGSYLVICTNWSTTPAPYIGLLTFSGATTNNFVKTDVVTGFTPTITITQNVSNTTIAISGAAKISIYALR